MTLRGESILRATLRITLYAAIERFISDHVVPEIEKTSVKVDKRKLLKKAEEVVDKSVDRTINELKRNNFNSLEELEKKPALVGRLMRKIQKDMINDAESLQKN